MSSVCRHPLFQLLKPVQHHLNLALTAFLLDGLEHKEVLAVWADGVVATTGHRIRLIWVVKERVRSSWREGGLRAVLEEM